MNIYLVILTYIDYYEHYSASVVVRADTVKEASEKAEAKARQEGNYGETRVVARVESEDDIHFE